MNKLIVMLFMLGTSTISFAQTNSNSVESPPQDVVITPSFISNIQKYKSLESFHDGLACVKRNGKYGYMNIKGEEVIPCNFTGADAYINGVARVVLNGKVQFIDVNGNVVPLPSLASTQLEETTRLRSSNGLIIKKVNGKYGFVNEKGKIVIPCKYDEVYDFSEGLAAVRKGDYWGFWGFINSKGEEVIPCKYDNAKPFKNGYAAVEQLEYEDGEPILSVEPDPHWGVIDKNGKVIIPFNYDFHYGFDDEPFFSDGIAIMSDSTEKKGYINLDGKIIAPCKYDIARPFSNGVAYVCFDKYLGDRGNKARYENYQGYVDKNGTEALVKCGEKEGTIHYKFGMKIIEDIEEIDNTTATTEEEVFEVVDYVASFPGGDGEMIKWIQQKMKYPTEAEENGESGRVVVKFIVDVDGTILNPIITKSVSPSIDKEAKRVVRNMPKWTPARKNGVRVKSYYTTSISFILTKQKN